MNGVTALGTTQRWFGWVSILAAIAMAGAVARAETPAKAEIKLTFKNGCPHESNADKEALVVPGQEVAWQGVDEDEKPASTDFKIYFDPFNGKPIESANGKIDKGLTIAKDVPTDVVFKYTLVARNGSLNCKAIDPRLRVGHGEDEDDMAKH